MNYERIGEALMSLGGSIIVLGEALKAEGNEAPKEKKTKKKTETLDPNPSAPENSGSPSPAPAPVQATETPAALTPDVLRMKLTEYAGKHGSAKAYEILGKYGAKKVVDLKPEHFEAVVKELGV